MLGGVGGLLHTQADDSDGFKLEPGQALKRGMGEAPPDLMHSAFGKRQLVKGGEFGNPFDLTDDEHGARASGGGASEAEDVQETEFSDNEAGAAGGVPDDAELPPAEDESLGVWTGELDEETARVGAAKDFDWGSVVYGKKATEKQRRDPRNSASGPSRCCCVAWFLCAADCRMCRNSAVGQSRCWKPESSQCSMGILALPCDKVAWKQPWRVGLPKFSPPEPSRHRGCTQVASLSSRWRCVRQLAVLGNLCAPDLHAFAQVVLNADLSRVTIRWALPTPLRGHVKGVSEAWLAPDEFEDQDTRALLDTSNESGYKVRGCGCDAWHPSPCLTLIPRARCS